MATKSITVATRLDPDLHRELAERAKAEDRKVANLMRRYIVQGLQRQEAPVAR